MMLVGLVSMQFELVLVVSYALLHKMSSMYLYVKFLADYFLLCFFRLRPRHPHDGNYNHAWSRHHIRLLL